MFRRFDLNALDPLVAPRLEDRRPPPPRKPPVAQRVCRPSPERPGVYLNPSDGKMFTQFSTMPKAPENDPMLARDQGSAYIDVGAGVELKGSLNANECYLMKQAPAERIVPLDELVRTVAQETAATEVKKLSAALHEQQQIIFGLQAQMQAQRRAWKTHLPRQAGGPGTSSMAHYDYRPPEELLSYFSNIEVRLANGGLYCTTPGSVNWGHDPCGGQHVVSWRYLD